MISDLNRLLAAHSRGEDTSEQFAEFMDKHGEFFPENPKDTDDLIDLLARRQDAAERMLRSLSPQQRDELARLMAEAMDDPDLESELSQLRDNLHALRPGLGRGRPVRMNGQEPMGYGDAVGAVADLADLEALERQLAQEHPGRHPRRRRRRRDRAPARAVGRRRPAGAARPRARARAAGLRQPRPRRAVAHPQGAAPAGRDGAAPDLRPARRRPPRRPRRVPRRLARRSAPEPRCPGRSATSGRSRRCRPCATRCSARRSRTRRCTSTSTTSPSPRPSAVRRPPWRCASTCRSRWCRRTAGGR